MTTGADDTRRNEVMIDSRGTLCPQPIIDLARAVLDSDSAPSPVAIVLLADDPAAVYDVPAWCRLRNCEVVVTTEADGSLRFEVRRSAAD